MVQWKDAAELSLSVIIILFNLTELYHIARKFKHVQEKAKLSVYISLALSNILIGAMKIIGSSLTLQQVDGNTGNIYGNEYNSLPIICFALQTSILHLIPICANVFLRLQFLQLRNRLMSKQRVRFFILIIWVTMIPGSTAIMIALKRNHKKSLINDLYFGMGIVIYIFATVFIAIHAYLIFMFKHTYHTREQRYLEIYENPVLKYKEDLIDIKTSCAFVLIFLFGFLPLATQGLLHKNGLIVTSILTLIKSALDPFVYYLEAIMIGKLRFNPNRRSVRYSMQEFSEPVPIAIIGRNALNS